MQPAPSPGSMRLRNRILWAVVVIIAVLLVLGLLRSATGAEAPRFHATAYDPPAPAADFTLTAHTGEEMSLSTLRGTPVLLFFGYTHCPDVCPLTLGRIREALEGAGAEPGEARVLLVSVDPARDTPAVLARYVERFGADVVGLTGREERIRTALSAYGVHVGPGHSNPAMLGHTSAVFGIDRAGMIRVLLRPDAPQDQLQEDVETLLDL